MVPDTGAFRRINTVDSFDPIVDHCEARLFIGGFEIKCAGYAGLVDTSPTTLVGPFSLIH
jgi:hypothetical protein